MRQLWSQWSHCFCVPSCPSPVTLTRGRKKSATTNSVLRTRNFIDPAQHFRIWPSQMSWFESFENKYFCQARLISWSEASWLDARVQLIIKKFNFVRHEKTMATIYRIKTEFMFLFSFWQLLTCADLTIFGVKITVTTIDPNFSTSGFRTSQIFIIYPNKIKGIWLMNASIDQSCAQGSIWGVKSPRLTFTPQVMTSGEFCMTSRYINCYVSCVVW